MAIETFVEIEGDLAQSIRSSGRGRRDRWSAVYEAMLAGKVLRIAGDSTQAKSLTTALHKKHPTHRAHTRKLDADGFAAWAEPIE